MATDVIMPKFGMAQEDAVVVRWLRAEGDAVEKGDALLEVETDKVIMEVESPATGTLRDIRAREGDRVPVTQVIAAIAAPGETSASQEQQQEARKATPLAKRVAEQAGIDLSRVPASEPDGKIRRNDVENYLVQASKEPTAGAGKPRATPAARFMARKHNLSLETIQGSGPLGRIQVADVDTAASQSIRLSEKAFSTEPTTPAQGEETPHHILDGPPDGLAVPVQGMRRTIATRLTQSYQNIPHVQFTIEATAHGMLALRDELEPLARQSGQPLSITSLLVKLCGWALKRHPRLNASWMEDKIWQHAAVNIGVAVALEDGLIVPVIHKADTLGLGEINRLLHEQTEKARLGRLTREDVTGGTFTISNLGMYGIDHFNALINPPECAILAVGHIRKQAVVVEKPTGDEIAIQPLVQLSLSVDHRAVDGAVAALFLQDLVSAIGKPGRIIW